MTSVLKITDGTDEIDLLDANGWLLETWTVAVPQAKGGGTYQQSSLSDGRRLVNRVFDTMLESFSLKCGNQPDQDTAIFQLQELERLLEKAVQYFTTDWQSEPVWIEAQAKCETELRYAVIQQYSIPELRNWYEQPFAADPAVIDNVTLILERLHWQADEPGTTTCVQVSGTRTECDLCFGRFNDSSSTINCGSNAAIDNLPAGDMTIECYLRLTQDVGGARQTLMDKSANFRIDYVSETTGFEVFIIYTVSGAFAGFPETGFDVDKEWHHFALTWDVATTTIRAWIDGVEPVYDLQQAGVGVYAGDAAANLHIGSAGGAASYWGSDIGWFRISNVKRYNADFTPPVRCTLPAIDANTVGQWIGAECVGTAIDNQEGTAALDGIATDVGLTCEDCLGSSTFGRSVTCLNEVYVANKDNVGAQLTHAFIDDGGVFSGNLIGAAAPFNLLPAVPAVGDFLYIGSTQGPFCSTVFDISTAQSGFTADYRYNNGVWAGLTVTDRTNAFRNTGVNSINWTQPSDWILATVNGIQAYWLRFGVLTISAPTAPAQDNRDLYTVNWGNVDIDDLQVAGDLPALIEIKYDRQGKNNIHRVFAGLRSISRGNDFSAYLNLSDVQVAPETFVNLDSAVMSFITDPRSSTGRAARYNSAGVSAIAYRMGIEFSPLVLDEYVGTYHCFVRFSVDTGTANDITLRLYWHPVARSTTGAIALSDTIAVPYVNNWNILSFGQISLPVFGSKLASGEVVANDGELAVYVGNTNAADVKFWDLSIIPIDEWAGDFTDSVQQSASNIAINKYLSMDSVLSSKHFIRGLTKSVSTDRIAFNYISIVNGRVILQANADQRLWFLATRFPSATTDEQRSENDILARLQIVGSARYISARGER